MPRNEVRKAWTNALLGLAYSRPIKTWCQVCRRSIQQLIIDFVISMLTLQHRSTNRETIQEMLKRNLGVILHLIFLLVAMLTFCMIMRKRDITKSELFLPAVVTMLLIYCSSFGKIRHVQF